jgi:enoyl-CoA hydratase/carnithine racemase
MEMWEAVERIMADYTADPAVRVVVLTGAGGRAFALRRRHLEIRIERSGEAAVAAYQAQTARA